ncbi:MAG: FimB/Mfa2 family fimbrial subunit [Bacteroidales bacterium]|nr:FimB/Mfa2 family fimbrial subunit [Bacteroidales bacterium]
MKRLPINWHSLLTRIGVAALMLLECNCVHQFGDDYVEPEPEPPTPDGPTVLRIKLEHETSMPLLAQITNTRARAEQEYDIRHTINIYPLESKADNRVSSRSPIKTLTATYPLLLGLDRTIEVEIDPGNYNVLVWTDYVPVGTTDDYHYITSDFSEITLSTEREHQGCEQYRDAFKGSYMPYVPSGETTEITIELERPMAKFYFIANDLREFADYMAKLDGRSVPEPFDSRAEIDTERYQVVFRYAAYMPCVFNIFTDHPADSRQGVSFKGQMRLIDTEEMELGFDYVFTNGIDTSVAVAVDIYDTDGTLLARSDAINVPLKRSHYTEVRGPFLTSRSNESVAINPEFDGEFNIEIK